ncbi:MAG TPA: hypothetical protein VKX31_01685 [Brumimicrobium sp.]|nr:hypothetical protein [Brumimicrobium sp.]
MKRLIALVLFLFFIFSCNKERENIDFGYEYFPMEEGVFVEYEVTMIAHNIHLNPQHDTIKYKLETIIGEEVVDNSGRLARKFFQSKYDLSTGEILDQRVWTRIIDENRGEVVEENQRKIRLVFPVKNGDDWNVNAFNALGNQEVYYEDVNVGRTIGGFALENTTKVMYDDFLSLVDYQKSHEIYAKGIGLVERKIKDLSINNFDTLNIQSGSEVHYKLLNYGKK